jgi:cbb3-type cytochrome c oxidase subunit III
MMKSHTLRLMDIIRQKQSRKMIVIAALAVLVCAAVLNGLYGEAISADEKTAAKTGMTCPYTGNPAAIAEGRKLFYKHCAECHGDGTGGSGPDLTDNEWVCGGSDEQIFLTISKGRPGGMPSWNTDLKDDEIWKIIAFIRSLKK